MKIVGNNTGLLVRLGVTAAALLLSQQALALGTDAGTTVSNQALVAYSVGGVGQTPIDSDPGGNSVPGNGNSTDFLVDRRVSFTLIEVGGAHTTPVSPNQNDVVTAFTLTNTSNAIMDFRLNVVDFAGLVHGIADSTNLANYRAHAGNGQGAGGSPTTGDLLFVDELIEDGVVEIFVFADAPPTVLNGQYANIELRATAADDLLAVATAGVLDADLAEDPGVDDPTEIESVFADAGNDGFEVAQDGYEIISAALEITKTGAVISDPFGSGKALPDAVIEYTVTLDNNGAAAIAQSVVLTDNIQIPDVTLEDDAYGLVQDVAINAGFCNADLGDADLDGCAYDPGTGILTVAIPDIAVDTVTTVTYQVRISPL